MKPSHTKISISFTDDTLPVIGEQLLNCNVEEPIKEPTSVVSPMVVVSHKNKLRICMDPTDLNKNIIRRHYPLESLEDISADISGSKLFTLLDCKRGCWQMEEWKRSQKYLIFPTPWGDILAKAYFLD
ncbi:hypothetical protein JTB14_017593 [Gonioctena quinquepunctata]|nr:hypothetical protein JTB14_017593 [Gonioctena quinquepunctata]